MGLVVFALQTGAFLKAFSAPFLLVAVFAARTVLQVAREHRERPTPAEAELDLDGLRARWHPAQPNPIRAVWASLLAALPVGIPLAVGVLATWTPSWDRLLYVALGGALWLVALWGLARHLWAEANTLQRVSLEVRGGQLRFEDGLLSRRTRSWALADVQARARDGSLHLETPDGPWSVACSLPEPELVALAGWITGSQGGRLEPPPQALVALRARQAEDA